MPVLASFKTTPKSNPGGVHTQFASHKLAASVCRDDFYEFVKEFWHEVVPDRPVWNWHIPYLCNEYQQMAERIFAGRPKLWDHVTNIPPGTSKSSVTSIFFPAWCWTRFMGFRYIGASYAFALQQDLSRKTRALVQSEKYRLFFPDVQILDDQNTKAYFATTKGGFRYGVGSGGSVLGYHAHFIGIDDPVSPEQAMSPAELATINRWIKTTLSTRLVDKAVSVVALVMQRLGLDDPTTHFLKRRKVKHVCLPAELSDLVQPPGLKRYYSAGGLLDPVRLSKDVLLEQEDTLGQFGFSAQYRQNPIPLGGGMFKVERFKDLDMAFPNDPVVRRVRFWDKAGTSGGGAFTVGIRMAVTKFGRYIVEDEKRGQWDSYAREAVIRRTAEDDGRAVEIGLEQEPGSGGKESVENTIRMLAGFRVTAKPAVGTKVDRADTFSTQVNGGNVYLPIDAPWVPAFKEEFVGFPFGKYKDRVDACSGAFAVLVVPKRRCGVLR